MEKITTIEQLDNIFKGWLTNEPFSEYLIRKYDVSHLMTYIDDLELGVDGDWQVFEDAINKYNANANVPTIQSEFDKDLSTVLTEMYDILISKNRKYGDSALNPQRIFAKSDTIEQLNVRIDDKLNRIKTMTANQIEDEDESVIDSHVDLIGYLIIKMIMIKRAKANQTS